MNMTAWALRWGIPFAALHELQTECGIVQDVAPEGRSESYVQSAVRLEAARQGVTLWRNNVGALQDKSGRLVRYGLANDTKEMNDIVKSADLIGIRPVTIGAEHVGLVIGQFVSRECKPEGWQYGNTDRERAQLAWLNLINANGGDAKFTTGGS